MSLRDRLNESLKDAMRAKNQVALQTIRMVIAAMKEADIEARVKGNMDGIADADLMSLMQKLIKQRRDSIAMYEQGGRPELAAKEQEEIGVIEGFLPKAMDEAEAAAVIKALVAELGAADMKDMGRVMAELRTRYAGQMDFGKASGLIKAALTGKAA